MASIIDRLYTALEKSDNPRDAYFNLKEEIAVILGEDPSHETRAIIIDSLSLLLAGEHFRKSYERYQKKEEVK